MNALQPTRCGLATAFAAASLTALLASACAPGDVPPAEAASVPLWVVDQDSVTVTPFSVGRTVHNIGGGTPVTFPVPSSGRLVIRSASGHCTSTDGVPLTTVRVSYAGDHWLAPLYTRTEAGTTVSTFTHETLMFFDPGASVSMMAFPTTSTQRTTCSVTLTGYLVEE